MKEINGEHPWGDAGQLILAGLFLLVWVLDSFFIHATTFLTRYIPWPIRLIILIAAVITALVLLRSAHFVVSQEKRPAMVITSGAFRYTRHPIYLASLLIYAGLTFSTASFASLALLIGVFVFHDYISSYEEAILEAKFGDEYRNYRAKTGKWIPRFWA
jgi:protein-S-isoprenylcysteine O-methyltransferase Ste14